MERWTPRLTRIINRRPRLTSGGASPVLVVVAGGVGGRRCGTDRPPFLGQPRSPAFALEDLRPHRGPPNRNRLYDSVLITGDRTHTPTRHMANALNVVNADAGRTRVVARAMVTAHRPCNNTDRSARRACSTHPSPAPRPLDSAADHILAPKCSVPPPSLSSDRSHAIILSIAERLMPRDCDD